MAAVLLIAVAFFAVRIPAQAAGDAAQGLQISPVTVNLNADPGKSYVLKLSLMNVTTGDLVFKSAVNDFTAKDETGTPNVILNSTLPASASVVNWVEPIGDIPLKSKESKTLFVKVTVPANAEAGGHYGVIRFSGTAPSQQPNGVALAASAGELLLVRVSGTITEQLKLEQFLTAQNGKTKSTFQKTPITFAERISNSGNVHVAPVGNVTVKNMFGKQVAELKVNENNGNILPNSTRKFEQALTNKNMFGRYTAVVNLSYGTQAKTLSGTLSFWVIPLKTVALVILAIIVIVVLMRWLIKRYNRWIVRKSR